MTPTNRPEKAEEAGSEKKQRHVEIRPLSTDEIVRAKEEGAIVMVMADCCCEVGGGVYGKLIIV